ncbi:MAG: CHC2 zinc finger domain-containing protein, partial [Nitrospiria bacterium]
MRPVNPFEAVKRRADIVEMIEKFTGMTAAGRGNHRQLPECPFCKGHGCFSITVDKQLFNCFQCPGESTGGDVFTFLSRLKGYDLRSALEELAGEVGYTLPAVGNRTRPGIRDAIMEQAKADWALPEAGRFRAYLVSERQLSEEVLRKHDVGCLRDRYALISDLKDKGYTYDEIKASGILTRGFGTLYRIVFGWRGLDGKVAGFVGAATKGQLEKMASSEKARFPKYKKSAHFKAGAPYNLYFARRRVPGDQTLVIVEGIVDCLHLLSIGIHHVIALGGTAFKEDFTKALQTTRFKRLILFFDSDA